MNHLKKFRTLNRTTAHRNALYSNMCEALFKYGKIKTTVIKAKEIRRVAEKIITKAKVNTLHNIRVVGKDIQDKDILKKLFTEIGPSFADRNGGYTRIIKLNKRLGDGADMAYLELINEEFTPKKKAKKDKPATADKPKAAAPAADAEVTADCTFGFAKDGDNVKFELKNGSNVIIASDAQAEESAKADLATLKEVAANAGIEDLDSDDAAEVQGAKYELYSKDKKFFFRIKSETGKILATSAAFSSKDAANKAINGIKSNIASFKE